MKDMESRQQEVMKAKIQEQAEEFTKLKQLKDTVSTTLLTIDVTMHFRRREIYLFHVGKS